MNFIGIIVSLVFIFTLIVLSKYLSNSSPELSRKFVHIGVSNWWIIAIIFFDKLSWICIIPILFVILNTISYKYKIFSSIERENNNSFGTIYYAISCLVLVILSYTIFDSMLYGGIGMLTMGYGDGMASLVGQKYGNKKYNVFGNKKTYIGSITMFIISTIVISIIMVYFNQFNIFKILFMAFIATLIEAISVRGTDNLSVPLLVTLIAYLIL